MMDKTPDASASPTAAASRTPPSAHTPPPPPRTPRSGARRALRWLAATLMGLLLFLALALGAGWWWTGNDSSLATTLTRVAHYLPADQQLESRDVTGSVRRGGAIGWLRWSSPSLAVEVEGIRVGWQLAPLLQRRLQLGEVHADRVTITPSGAPSDQPATPLEQLPLPLQIDLPFSADQVQWAGNPAVEVLGLRGHYQYDGSHHTLDLVHAEVAQGTYSAQAKVQALAPMAITLTANGKVQATPPGDGAHALEVDAQASLKGTLAGAQAELNLQAQLNPSVTAPTATTTQSKAMSANVQATLRPWASQPVVQALADLQNLNVAAIWPAAPVTELSGQLRAGPSTAAPAKAPSPSASTAPAPAASDATGWALQADLRNALPGPWDAQRLPLTAVTAQVHYDGTQWTVESARAELPPGAGGLDLQGHFSPATQAADLQLDVRALRPDALHNSLAAAPLTGRLRAQGAGDQRIQFSADVHAAGGLAPAPARKGKLPLRIQQFTAQGNWLQAPGGGVLRIEQLLLEALDARVQAHAVTAHLADRAGEGQLQITAPGITMEAQGNMGPRQGQGKLAVQLSDAERSQRWLAQLPGLGDALKAATAQGAAQARMEWTGGWQTALDQVQAASAGQGFTPGQPAFKLQATLSSQRLDITLPASSEQPAAPTSVQLRAVQAEVAGTLAQASWALDGEVRSNTLSATTHARASTQLDRSGQWNATVSALRLSAQDSQRPGPWQLALADALTLSLRSTPARNARTTATLALESSAGEARISGPAPGTVNLRWEPLRYRSGGTSPLQLVTRGQLQGLPMAWVDAISALQANGQPAPPLLAPMGLSGNLVFDGQWAIDTSGPLRAQASLRRTSGDLRLLTGDASSVTAVYSSGQGASAGQTTTLTQADTQATAAQGTPAGVREAQLSIDVEGDALQARLQWASDRAGEVQLQARTQLSLGSSLSELNIAETAPLSGTVVARMPDIGVWSALAPPGWRVRGTLDANVQLSGTRAQPRWTGNLGADQLAVRALLDGVDLQGGRLRAQLQGNALNITEFQLQGGKGSQARILGFSGNRTSAPLDGGLLTGNGRLSWGESASAEGSGIRMDFKAQAKALQVLVRADRQASVSGDIDASLNNGQFKLGGKLTVDRATIILPDESAPSLGSDVVVRSAAKDREAQAKAQASAQSAQKSAAQAEMAKPPLIAITVDLGRDFALQGMGITTRLKGAVDIHSSTVAGAAPRVTGEIQTDQGRYRAWGQELDVETGLIRFNGPYNNPSLDILALRPNISVRAGVQVTGSAMAPRVRLYSDPELPDAEKLSWVVMGRSASAGGAEAALLQQAALALLGGGNGGAGLTDGLASSLGLDEVGFKGPGSGDDASAAALTFGKRLSKDLYVTYERSLSGTLGTLYIFYDLTRRLTLRGQTGEKNGVDIIYTVKYD